MMTSSEKKVSRKETQHRYYMKNHTKWNSFYPASNAAKTGTGNLGSHREDNFTTELIVIEKEMRRIGLKTTRTQVYESERRTKK